MKDMNEAISAAHKQLKKTFEDLEDKRAILKSEELRKLYSQISDLPKELRGQFGKKVNDLKQELEALVEQWQSSQSISVRGPIDVTAPFDENTPKNAKPKLLGPSHGSSHPIVSELDRISDIFLKMGFDVEESRQVDDEYHMFGSLNFPKGHPARDEYDTFLTDEGLVLPAHTSNMQNRVMRKYDVPIRVVIPGRVFRNEDLDAYHEHTFHQVEGVVVDSEITLGDMLGTITRFLEEYFGEKIEYKTQPFYFPFVEPGLEFLIKTPKALRHCVNTEWMEIMGCGMIHPNVLKEAGLDANKYTGFAWGMGVERMVMLRYGIEDIRHFMSGNLDFLKQFGVSS